MTSEWIYRCKTPAALANRAAGADFYAYSVNQLVYSDDPDQVIVEVDMNGAISPVTGKQVVAIAVLPHNPTSVGTAA